MSKFEWSGGYRSDEGPAAVATVELHLSPRFSRDAVERGEYSGSVIGGTRGRH